MEQNPAIHILYLSKWYPTAADPMPGLFVRKHALAAVSAGYRVTVVHVSQLQHPLGALEEHFNEGSLTEYIYYLPKSKGISGVFKQLKVWEKAMQLVHEAQGKPDLIHAHVLTRLGFLAWWLSVGSGTPIVVTEHWSRYFRENMQYTGFLRKRITEWVVKKAAAVTVVSQRLAVAMHKQGLKFNPVILPNVVDTNLFKLVNIKSEVKTIISITCFEEKSKNLSLLLRAFKKLHSVHPEVRLKLVGEGADLEWTKALVETIDLKNSVEFTGLLEGKVLADALSNASCLAISSKYETFAIVAYEALSCGVPVVATDVADLSLHIPPEWGEIVPVGDESALFDALLKVLETNSPWPEADMHQFVDTHYSEKAAAQVLNEVYTAALTKRR